MKTFDTIVLLESFEIAEQLGVSVLLVRKLLRTGAIKGRKIGNSWYATPEAVKAYLTGDNQE